MHRLLILSGLFLSLFLAAIAATMAQTPDLQSILQENRKSVERASRKTIEPFLEILVASKLPGVPLFLEKWRAKQVWQRKDDGLFFYLKDAKSDPAQLVDISNGETVGAIAKSSLDNLKPNSGVRSVIAATLVRYQLFDENPKRRLAALAAIERDPETGHLEILRATVKTENDPKIRERMERLERLLTISFDKDSSARVEAIRGFAGDTNVDVRAALNPLLQTSLEISRELPEGANIARRLSVGRDIENAKAYDLLVERGLAPAGITNAARDAALVENLKEGAVAGFTREALDNEENRIAAYRTLSASGLVPPYITAEERRKAIDEHVFFERYAESEKAITAAASEFSWGNKYQGYPVRSGGSGT